MKSACSPIIRSNDAQTPSTPDIAGTILSNNRFTLIARSFFSRLLSLMRERLLNAVHHATAR